MVAFRHACVTGGAGFIGSHLTRALLTRGISVTVLDNLNTGTLRNLPHEARVVVADVIDEAGYQSILKNCDIVFHLAARVAIRSSYEFVVEDSMVNVCGTAAVLRASQKAGSIRKIISTSSMAVYADVPDPTPLRETYRTEPVSPYGISKLAAEQLTHSFGKTTGIDTVVLRLFNTYGPGQKYSPYVGVVTIFINKLRSEEQAIIFGDGEQARDFVHVEDVVSGFLGAMDADVRQETFNIGSGQARSVNSVYETIAKHLGVTRSPNRVDAVPGELRNSVADISKARRLLGYEPKHDFEVSIDGVIQEVLAEVVTC